MNLRTTATTKISPLQQLLEDINFQRTKELRNFQQDDMGFVVLQGNTQWTEIFVRHFLFQNPEAAMDQDDLLFFVRKKYVKGSNRAAPKYDTEIEVFRKDSKKLPIGDPEVDWEETVYLNLVIHQFDYFLTLAICTRTSPKELQVLKRHSQRVYASPSRRKMDSKGESEDITFPHICFMVDNFDEVFSDIFVRDGEMVCVELVAKDHDGSTQGVIFLGSIRYDALKKVYDARQSSLSSKMAQRMIFGLFSSVPQMRCEFVRMKGPSSKGFAEMAVTKPKGSGIETPTSEPGFCMTDMWDSECEDKLDEFYETRHQRRLSDPSSNLNNFSKNNWRTKPHQTTSNTKALSQNEGLDSLANDISEIEAGDLRDDRPASSASDTEKKPKNGCQQTIEPPLSPSTTCCSCFSTTKSMCAKNASVQFSEIYCPACSNISINSLKTETTINKLGHPEHINRFSKLKTENEYSKYRQQKFVFGKSNMRKTFGAKIKESFEDVTDNADEYEMASEAANTEDKSKIYQDDQAKIEKLTDKDKKQMIKVNGKEEIPFFDIELEQNFITEYSDLSETGDKSNTKTSDCGTAKVNFTYNVAMKIEKTDEKCNESNSKDKLSFPSINNKRLKNIIAIPQRTTTDGTKIYYICDLPLQLKKELDDGQYNPLWTTKGFTQTFHFWKENRRQSSTPLNAYITYISLPWFCIVKDLIDHREMPILTF